jgi:hypothetical protein
LYGRAALQLGFATHPGGAAMSKDVDCIIPAAQLDGLTADEGFWNAQEATNEKLRPAGLYITHLFRDDRIFLRQNWDNHLVPITKIQVRHLPSFSSASSPERPVGR